MAARRASRRLRLLGRTAAALAAALFAAAVYVYLTLPDVGTLRTRNPESTAFMQLRAREARAQGEKPNRSQRWVPYSRISPQLKRAVLVAEDSAFWQHDGLDYDQLRESMEVNLERMEFVRGASTITQQLAKNLYLSPSKNPIRKLRELLITRRLEAELTKQRIFELYLNVIEWGDGIYGAEAAARAYFGVSAAQLDARQSALLAGAIINARLLNPAHPSARLRRRQQMILARMGAATPPPAAPADAEPLEPVPPLPIPDSPPAAVPETLPGEPVEPRDGTPAGSGS